MSVIDDAPEGKVKDQLKQNQQSLRINRLPKYIRDIFIKVAEEEFCNDYGMLLTVLVERYLKGGKDEPK